MVCYSGMFWRHSFILIDILMVIVNYSTSWYIDLVNAFDKREACTYFHCYFYFHCHILALHRSIAWTNKRLQLSYYLLYLVAFLVAFFILHLYWSNSLSYFHGVWYHVCCMLLLINWSWGSNISSMIFLYITIITVISNWNILNHCFPLFSTMNSRLY